MIPVGDDSSQRCSSSVYDPKSKAEAEPITDSDGLSGRSRPRYFRYGMLVSWLIISLLLVLDRFYTNIWPRQSFTAAPCFGKCGGDFFCSFGGEDGPPGCLRPGPWTAKTFDVLARASARWIVSTTNLMFLTVCHCTWNWLAERRYLKRFLYTWREDNLWIHKIAGWSIVLWTLAHMWSLFLPSIFHGYQNVHVSGPFEFMAQVGLAGPQIDTEDKLARWGSDDVSNSLSLSKDHYLATCSVERTRSMRDYANVLTFCLFYNLVYFSSRFAK